MTFYCIFGAIIATLGVIALGITSLFHVGWARWTAGISLVLAIIMWAIVIRAFRALASM